MEPNASNCVAEFLMVIVLSSLSFCALKKTYLISHFKSKQLLQNLIPLCICTGHLNIRYVSEIGDIFWY
jgi:hypothetical protein